MDGSQTIDPRTAVPTRGSARRKALEFLRSRPGVAAKVLVGGPSSGKSQLLDTICAELRDYIVLRSNGAAEDASVLLSRLLKSADLNPADLSDAEQHNLLEVFVHYHRRKGGRIVLAVDDADKLGAEAWEELAKLHALQLEMSATLELIVAGRPDVYRRLRSPFEGWNCAHTKIHSLQPSARPVEANRAPPIGEIIVNHNGKLVKRLPLKQRMLLGRSKHNDVCLNGPQISRHHAVVVGTPDGYYIVDLNSKNGLMLNGETVTSGVLRDKDVVSLGPFRLKFMKPGPRHYKDPRPESPSLASTLTMRSEPGRKVPLQRVK